MSLILHTTTRVFPSLYTPKKRACDFNSDLERATSAAPTPLLSERVSKGRPGGEGWKSARGPRVQTFPGHLEFRSGTRDREGPRAARQRENSGWFVSARHGEGPGGARRTNDEEAASRQKDEQPGLRRREEWDEGVLATRGLFVNQFPVAGSW